MTRLAFAGLLTSIPSPSLGLDLSAFLDMDVVSLALARDVISNFTSLYSDREEQPLEDFIIGTSLHHEEGIAAHHPVIMLPVRQNLS